MKAQFKKALSILMALVFAAVPAIPSYFVCAAMFGKVIGALLGAGVFLFSLDVLLRPSRKE